MNDELTLTYIDGLMRGKEPIVDLDPEGTLDRKAHAIYVISHEYALGIAWDDLTDLDQNYYRRLATAAMVA